MNKVTLLSTRNKMKSKKPKFERQDVNIFKQFRGQWRKPKGIHSKLRRGFKGHKASPSIGYSSPSNVSGLTRKGFVPLVIFNIKDLENVDEKIHTVVIGHGVGIKKRTEILTKAKEKKIQVLGFKDIDSFLIKVKTDLDSRKKGTEKRKEEKKKRAEQAQKVKEDKKDKKQEEKKDESKK